MAYMMSCRVNDLEDYGNIHYTLAEIGDITYLGWTLESTTPMTKTIDDAITEIVADIAKLESNIPAEEDDREYAVHGRQAREDVPA